jgi:hypothetical protein
LDVAQFDEFVAPEPAIGIARLAAGHLVWNESPLVIIGILKYRHHDLPHIAGTLHLVRLSTSAVEGWKQKADENRDYSNYHEKFDQRKCITPFGSLLPHGTLLVKAQL